MDIEQYEKLTPVATLHLQDGKSMKFHTPNRTALWRVQTLQNKEPYTLFWLEGMRPGEVLLDVGANVGMYTITAAVMKDMRVYAFEPESQNYALLNRNIHANGLSGRVTAFACGLSDHTGLDTLYLSQFEAAGSCHSLGAEVGFDLRPRPAGYAQGCVSWTIDAAVASGAIEVPRYIKIDVDGFEHKVIAGARETLRNPAVKELLIEVNPHLPEHLAMIEELGALGFRHDPIQTLMAGRDEGPFKGIGEWIFKRHAAEETTFHFPHQPYGSAEPEGPHAAAWQHVLDRIVAAPIEAEPFPFAIVDDVFPRGYYREMQAYFPTDAEMRPLSETGRVTEGFYKERMCTALDPEDMQRLDADRRAFWEALARQLFAPHFLTGVIERFMPHIADRLQVWSRDGETSIWGDAQLNRDRTRYSIGPHTDAPHRLLTFLFYLPEDASLEPYGTSIYAPRDPGLVCVGRQHHPFDAFRRLDTIGFLPNRLFVFAKNVRSFHGVEPIMLPDLDRRLLIYNVRLPSLSL